MMVSRAAVLPFSNPRATSVHVDSPGRGRGRSAAALPRRDRRMSPPPHCGHRSRRECLLIGAVHELAWRPGAFARHAMCGRFELNGEPLDLLARLEREIRSARRRHPQPEPELVEGGVIISGSSQMAPIFDLPNFVPSALVDISRHDVGIDALDLTDQVDNSPPRFPSVIAAGFERAAVAAVEFE